MSMYVWHDVLEDHASGNICALAPSEQAAWGALFKADRVAYLAVLGLSQERWNHYYCNLESAFTAAELRRLAPNRVRPKKYTKPFAVVTWGGG